MSQPIVALLLKASICWGEFLLIAVNDDEIGITGLAARQRLLISHGRINSATGPIRVTISGGAAVCTTNDTVQTLIKRADDALYRAKSEGRDRIVFG